MGKEQNSFDPGSIIDSNKGKIAAAMIIANIVVPGVAANAEYDHQNVPTTETVSFDPDFNIQTRFKNSVRELMSSSELQSSTVAKFKIGSKSISLNGANHNLDTSMLATKGIDKKTVPVGPIKSIAGDFSLTASYDKANKKMTIKSGDVTIKLKANNRYYSETKDGHTLTKKLTVPPSLTKSGIFMAPTSALSELGIKTVYDSKTKTGSLEKIYKLSQKMAYENASKYTFVDPVSVSIDTKNNASVVYKKNVVNNSLVSALNLEKYGKAKHIYAAEKSAYVFDGTKLKLYKRSSTGKIVENNISLPASLTNTGKMVWLEAEGRSGVYVVNKTTNEIIYRHDVNNRTWNKELSQSSAVNLACKYMAGGEFLDKNALNFKVETVDGGVTRVYAGLEATSVEKALFNKVATKCKYGDVMYSWNGKICVLGLDSQRVWFDNSKKVNAKIYDNNLNKKDYSGVTGQFFYPNIEFRQDLGLCLSDGNRICYKSDNNGKFVELNQYLATGTKEEIATRVERGVDKDQYLGGKFNKKVWLNDANGDKAICLLIGGERGMPARYEEVWRNGVARCNEIDPNLMEKMVEQYGLNVISNVPESSNTGQDANFVRSGFGGMIYYNCWPKEDSTVDNLTCNIPELIIVESRGLYNTDHNIFNGIKWQFNINDKVVETNDVGIEKQAYAAVQLEEYASVPENKRIKFDENKKVTLEEVNAVYNSLVISPDYMVGKLKYAEFVAIGTAIGGYNFYVEG
ncbi:MAG: stalk domain-containing protein [Candidatus Shapirobacteria bacterium]